MTGSRAPYCRVFRNRLSAQLGQRADVFLERYVNCGNLWEFKGTDRLGFDFLQGSGSG